MIIKKKGKGEAQGRKGTCREHSRIPGINHIKPGIEEKAYGSRYADGPNKTGNRLPQKGIKTISPHSFAHSILPLPFFPEDS